MTAQRRISVGEWGTAHLGPDAVVAFVDDELARRPHERAIAHVENCPECATEIRAQRRARSALRGADGPGLPSSLLSALRAIPQGADLPPTADLAVSPDGDVVTVLRSVTPLTPAPRTLDPPAAAPGRRPGRRVRFGAGVAASGLAIGALTFGAATLPDPFGWSGPEESGLFGGPALAPAAGAAFGVEPVRSPDDARMLDHAARAPRTFLRDALR